jgi:hypothetical protein
MITEFQKQIYNLYLKAYRINNGNPFRAKKNFDKLSDEIKTELIKLERFFAKFPHLLTDDFFNAPYRLYEDENKFYGLKFYSSQKGLTTCVEYFKTLAASDPDQQLDYIKASLKFITEFCVEKRIPFESYTSYRSVAQLDFLKHLKEHKISWYCVTGLPSLLSIVYDLPEDEFLLYFGSDIDLFAVKQKYDNSVKTKKLFADVAPKLANFVRQKLQKNQQ